MACLTEKERVPDDRSDKLKGSLPKSLARPWDTENPRLNEENEKKNRGEATRRGMEELYQR